ncbi:hypothetical protein BJY52DRAFT_1306581 [Lactarius psammicola]|nr:hypothetical protein BJY52DRAFT_1306581 [Lactarius psammicola]
MRQHIAFGARPWNIGDLDVKEKDATLRKEGKTRVHGFVEPLLGRNTSVGLPLKYSLRTSTSTSADLEALADDLEAHAATSSSADALPRIYRKQGLRMRLLVVLATTQDVSSAWAAYRALLVLPRSFEKARPKVPFAHRHRLLRLLAAAPHPRPRGRFAQVLAVLRALHDAGGTVQRWHWNLLLDCAGKEGWRRPREEHFRAALALLAEMHGGHEDGNRRRRVDTEGGGGGLAHALAPDIYSYSTLIAHAVRTCAPAAVRHAMQLLARAGLSPGAHAYTALLCFFARRRDLAGVRDTLFRMRRQEQAQEGGCAGLSQVPFNVVLWAFAYNGRLDVAQAMYRVVCARRASPPGSEVGKQEHEEERRDEEEEEEEEEEELEAALAEREMVIIARDVVPDAATHNILIQACAYHGDLLGCLEMLTDMLSASATSSASRLTAFRAIFLGFARHGIPPCSSSPPKSTSANAQLAVVPPSSEWTLPTLEALFARFLEVELSQDTRPRENMLFWLVSAFARTSGHDADVLRRVLERVESRFGYVWTSSGAAGGRGRLARIRERFIP